MRRNKNLHSALKDFHFPVGWENKTSNMNSYARYRIGSIIYRFAFLNQRSSREWVTPLPEARFLTKEWNLSIPHPQKRNRASIKIFVEHPSSLPYPTHLLNILHRERYYLIWRGRTWARLWLGNGKRIRFWDDVWPRHSPQRCMP